MIRESIERKRYSTLEGAYEAILKVELFGGNTASAEEKLTEWKSIYSKENQPIKVVFYEGLLNVKKKDLARAIELSTVIEQAGDKILPNLLKGEIAMAEGKYDDAIINFESARRVNPLYYAKLADLHNKINRKADAESYKQKLSMWDQPGLDHALGLIYQD